MEAYRDQAGADNVHETRETGTVVLTVEPGGTWALELDSDTGNYADSYGWSEDDDDDDDGGGPDDSGDGGGGGGRSKASGTVPPPGRPDPKPKPDRGRRYG